MNWLFLGVIGFLIIAIMDGYHKGFINKLVGILALIITLMIASVVTPYIYELLESSTSVLGLLQEGIANSNNDIMSILQTIGMNQTMGGYLAGLLLHMAAYLITFILVSIVIQGFALSLHVVSKLPILNQLNRLLGMVLGLAEGVFYVWVGFFVITIFCGTDLGGKLLGMIARSDLLSYLYVKNVLLQFVVEFLL